MHARHYREVVSGCGPSITGQNTQISLEIKTLTLQSGARHCATFVLPPEFPNALSETSSRQPLEIFGRYGELHVEQSEDQVPDESLMGEVHMLSVHRIFNAAVFRFFIGDEFIAAESKFLKLCARRRNAPASLW